MNIYEQEINRIKCLISNITPQRAALNTEKHYELHISPFCTAIHYMHMLIAKNGGGSFVLGIFLV